MKILFLVLVGFISIEYVLNSDSLRRLSYASKKRRKAKAKKPEGLDAVLHTNREKQKGLFKKGET